MLVTNIGFDKLNEIVKAYWICATYYRATWILVASEEKNSVFPILKVYRKTNRKTESVEKRHYEKKQIGGDM